MSQRNRRVLAAAGLAALLFMAPVPSHAVGVREGEIAAFAARAWSWLEGFGLLPRPATPARRQPATRREEKAIQEGPLQGSAIDPNGGMTRLSNSASSAPVDQGSAIDPNGGW